jgi:tRNA G46 methylase TrmB
MGLESSEALFEEQNLSRLTEVLKSHGEICLAMDAEPLISRQIQA